MGKREKNGKKRKIFNLYNLIILICIVIIIGSLYIILGKNQNIAPGLKEKIDSAVGWVQDTWSNLFSGEQKTESKTEEKTNGMSNSNNTKNTIQTGENTNQEDEENNEKSNTNAGISVDEAKEIAINEFIKLGEEGLTMDNVKVKGVLRGGEKYYLVSSEKNSVEIRMEDGKTSRINDEQVD